jgi:hypothetical protein
MRIREYEFDGTPEEFLKVAGALRGTQSPARSEQVPSTVPASAMTENPPRATPQNAAVPDASRFVTKEQAIRILTRRKLSPHMQKLMGELYHAGNTKVLSDHLRKLLGFDDETDPNGSDRFRGLMGAFGRRVVHDVGAQLSFFDADWNADEGQKTWRLPTSVREAVDDLGWYR